MKNSFPGIIGLIGAALLKLIYGPAYERRWWADPDSGVRGVEAALSLGAVLWVMILVLLFTDTVPLHALIYLVAFPAALAIWALVIRRRRGT